MKSLAICVILSVLTIFMSGCSTFTYNQKTYSSAEEALQAQTEHLTNIENKIVKSDKKFAGKAIVVVPSKKTCDSLGIKRTGAPPAELTNYIANSMVSDLAKFSDYIKKRELFDSVEHAVEDFTKPYADQVKNNHFAVIYMQLLSPDQAGWFVMVKPDFNPKPIHFSSTAEVGYPKIQSWLDDLEKTVYGESNVK